MGANPEEQSTRTAMIAAKRSIPCCNIAQLEFIVGLESSIRNNNNNGSNSQGKKKKSTPRSKNKLDTTLKYLQFWNSMFNLTPKELKVLVEFIDISTYDVICTKSDKKAVAMVLGFSDPNTLNNYIKKLPKEIPDKPFWQFEIE